MPLPKISTTPAPSTEPDPVERLQADLRPVSGGRPSGAPLDVLTGFVSDDGKALGRPVGVAVDGRGDLLVADHVGNLIWRVTAAKGSASAG